MKRPEPLQVVKERRDGALNAVGREQCSLHFVHGRVL